MAFFTFFIGSQNRWNRLPKNLIILLFCTTYKEKDNNSNSLVENFTGYWTEIPN